MELRDPQYLYVQRYLMVQLKELFQCTCLQLVVLHQVMRLLLHSVYNVLHHLVLIMITEGADFLGVSSVELRMPGYNTINDTVCTNVLVVNDTDIEDQEQFNILLETFDPAVRILLKFATIIIPVDPYDSKWQFSVFHLTIFIPQLLYLEYQMLQSQ